jgi:hypothetical protein
MWCIGMQSVTLQVALIFTCTAFQARWALSADESLQEVGSSTGIHYLNDYQEYLMILETGLRQKKKSIINVIKQWDVKIFPDSDSSLVRQLWGKKDGDSGGLKKAMDLLAADLEEDEDNLCDDGNGQDM